MYLFCGVFVTIDEEPFENFQEQDFEDFDQQQETEQGKYILWSFLVPIIRN